MPNFKPEKPLKWFTERIGKQVGIKTLSGIEDSMLIVDIEMAELLFRSQRQRCDEYFDKD